MFIDLRTSNFGEEVQKYYKKILPDDTNKEKLKEANIPVMINFIGYMMKFILNYREEMFKFEDFKDSVKGEDKLILLVEYEK